MLSSSTPSTNNNPFAPFECALTVTVPPVFTFCGVRPTFEIALLYSTFTFAVTELITFLVPTGLPNNFMATCTTPGVFAISSIPSPLSGVESESVTVIVPPSPAVTAVPLVNELDTNVPVLTLGDGVKSLTESPALSTFCVANDKLPPAICLRYVNASLKFVSNELFESVNLNFSDSLSSSLISSTLSKVY